MYAYCRAMRRRGRTLKPEYPISMLGKRSHGLGRSCGQILLDSVLLEGKAISPLLDITTREPISSR